MSILGWFQISMSALAVHIQHATSGLEYLEFLEVKNPDSLFLTLKKAILDSTPGKLHECQISSRSYNEPPKTNIFRSTFRFMCNGVKIEILCDILADC